MHKWKKLQVWVYSSSCGHILLCFTCLRVLQERPTFTKLLCHCFVLLKSQYLVLLSLHRLRWCPVDPESPCPPWCPRGRGRPCRPWPPWCPARPGDPWAPSRPAVRGCSAECRSADNGLQYTENKTVSNLRIYNNKVRKYKFWQILLHVTDDAKAKFYVAKSLVK